ncbi:WhiB family transcriptional regulator [Streptomyces sp. NPDC004658]|uniref:WhiB family transcriptional regulator n=1 Tax=Streptomyces sp. NPDC004658 TaxID=3154672 RepID=UPI0033A4F50E
MTHYSGSVPETKRKIDWRAKAACRDVDPDDMFPENYERGIQYAKSICGGCPVRTACLIDAIDVGDNDHGIRGGLRPQERRAVARTVGDQYHDPQAVESAIMRALYPSSGERSLREVWEGYTKVLPGGHVGWTGKSTFPYRGHSYAPKKVAFMLHRGRAPEGNVRRTCAVVECVNPLHLADSEERARAEQLDAAATANAA